MNKPQTIKGRLMHWVAKLAVAGPWRGAAERLACVLGHRFPTNRAVLSLCRHLGASLIEREGSQFERVVVFSTGGRMRCGGEDSFSALCLLHYFLGNNTSQHEDEEPLCLLLRRALRNGDIFFDIGANFGFYSFFLGPLCGTTGEVHAFEANPLLIPHLCRSAKLNKARANIKINAMAVGAEGNKTLQLYDPDRIGGSSLYPLAWLDTRRSVSVPMTTIDDYRRANDIRRLDVIKIDIEGAELEAFRGMQETLGTSPPWLIACELLPPFSHGSTAVSDPLEIVKFLRARGYEPRFIRNQDGRLNGRIELGDIERMSQDVLNVAFVRTGLEKVRPELFVGEDEHTDR
jgi:FkbM family methyltransferase